MLRHIILLTAAISVAPLVAVQPECHGQTPPGSASEAAAKEAILNSSRWREMMAEFHEWLSKQVVYTPQQVAAIEARLDAEIQKMSAAELQHFLDQWDAKLKILLGKDAAEAREWLGQFLSVAADGYRKKVLEQLGITDVSTMTAAQLEDVIHNIRAKELRMRQERAVFDQSRADQIQFAQKYQSERSAALARAGQSQASKYGTYQSHMSPKHYDWRPRAPLIPWGWW